MVLRLGQTSSFWRVIMAAISWFVDPIRVTNGESMRTAKSRRLQQMPEFYDAPETDGLYVIKPMGEQTRDQWDGLRAVYGTLPSRQRELVNLLLDGHQSQTAIAAMLGVKKQTVA